MEFERQRRDSGGINITPIIDMVFLLIIFFLLTSSFMRDRGISVNLPVSSSSFSQKQERITVTIGSAGAVFVNGQQIAEGLLLNSLNEIYRQRGSKNVLIKADRGNTVERLVQVMDIIKKSGAKKLTLATQIKNYQVPER